MRSTLKATKAICARVGRSSAEAGRMEIVEAIMVDTGLEGFLQRWGV